MLIRAIPEVADDVAQAAEWYDRFGYLGLGDRFEQTFFRCLLHLESNGQIYRRVYSDFRRIFLKPFPYALYFREHNEELVVTLVIHATRDPELVRRLLTSREG